MIQITATGNIAREAELSYTQAGKAWAKVSVACNTRSKNAAGEWVGDPTFWVRMVVFGNDAERVAEYRVGDQILFSGTLKVSEWEKDGVTKSTNEVVANSVALVRAKQSDTGPQKVSAPF